MEDVPAWYLDQIRGHQWLVHRWPEVAQYIEDNQSTIHWELGGWIVDEDTDE